MRLAVKFVDKGPAWDIPEMRRGIQRALNRVSARAMDRLSAATKTWETPPNFRVQAEHNSRKIEVRPALPFLFVDAGTRGHWIPKRPGARLIFRVPYKAKTRPWLLDSGPGGPGDNWRSADRVWHPGTEPRHFTEAVAALMDQELAEEIALEITGALGGGGR